MAWAAVVASTAGGAATTLLGVVAGGLLSRRAQDRHWLKDSKSATYAAVLREYMRVEFDLRQARHRRVAPEVDWAQWGAALAGLSLVGARRPLTVRVGGPLVQGGDAGSPGGPGEPEH